MSLTPRENLLNVLRHKKTEWTPIIGHVDSYNRPSDNGLPAEISDAAKEHGWWSGHAAIAYSRLLGIDIAAWTDSPLKETRKLCSAEYTKNERDTAKIVHTPKGDMREVVRTSEDGSTKYIVEHLIKDAKDLPKFAAWYEDRNYELDKEKNEEVNKRAKEIGEDGILISALSGTPLGMLIRVYAGPEAVSYLHADAPEALTDLFRVMESSHTKEFSFSAKSKIDAFLGMDDTSTTTQSLAMFQTYCVNYTNRIADLLHEKGKFYWHHSCGLIKDLLPLYRHTRMDAVHAFTEPNTGNVWINEGHEILGTGIAIIAGLQLMENPLTNKHEASIYIQKLFERIKPGQDILCLTPYQHLTMDEIRWIGAECKKYK